MTSKQTAEPLSFKETECQQRMLATPIPNADAKAFSEERTAP